MSRDVVSDESGMTLVELLVATAAGVIVMFGVVTAVVVSMHATGRVTGHVDANQRARITMTKIINQLHSACVAPQISPIQEESSGTSITFLHQTGSAVSPTPVKSTIALAGTTLSQLDYAATGGTAPEWQFSTTPTSTVLMTGVSPLSPSVPLFRYFAYDEGEVSDTPLSTPLGGDAATVVQVNVAFKTAPMSASIANDAGAETGIQSAALLRLTPPAYGASSSNLPCQ